MGLSNHNRRRSLRLEPLEARTLLTVSVDLAAHAIFVEGTPRADNIQIAMVGEDLSVSVNQENTTVPASDLAQVNGLEIKGLGGNDSIRISDNVALNALIDGGTGNDRIKGGGGNDDILGDAGADIVNGGAGDDRISGGSGRDSIRGGSGSDDIHGDAGDDAVSGDAGDDNLHGDAGRDRVSGGAGNDDVFGDDGNDALHGGAGDDSVDGGDGSDQETGDDGNDVLHGGSGRDRMSGGNGNDFVSGDDGDDAMTGAGGDDSVFGGQGSDRMTGGRGSDRLSGDDGNDAMDGGGPGQDDLIDGGAGSDRSRHGSEVEFNNELRAFMTDAATGAKAEAEFEFESEGGVVEQKLKIKVRHAAPNATLDVTIGGTLLTQQVTTDADGRGLLILRQDEVPAIAVDTTIAIVDSVNGTTFSGAFAALPDVPDEDPNVDRVKLAALLTDPGNAAALGEVEWEAETQNGVTVKKLTAEVEHVAANTTFDVLVDGVVVGSIATNSLGRGILVLSDADLPPGFDVTLGLTAQISNLTLAPPVSLSGAFADPLAP
jgi:Ca2+-binding RTX toxin-like protein